MAQPPYKGRKTRLRAGGCGAYRMQLFLYVKASGRKDLISSNLWSAIDLAAE